MFTLLALVLAFSLGALSAAAAALRAEPRRRTGDPLSLYWLIDQAALRARRQMNDAAGQSWRNMID